MSARMLFAFLVLVAIVFSCSRSNEEAPVSSDSPPPVRVRFTALPENVSFPPNNPQSPVKVKLGKLLFFDPILSGDKDVACATCHHPNSGYAESREISIGVNGQGFGAQRIFKQPNSIPFTKRNSPTLINVAFNGMDIFGDCVPHEAPMFWDNRIASLEGQSLEPIKAMEEMRGLNYSESEILPEVIRRLKEIKEYEELFEQAFPGEDPINTTNLAKAIASFERTLVANNSRFDKYMRGDKEALSVSEIEGFQAFKLAGCGNCHNGPMFSDYLPHVLGAPESRLLGSPDHGVDSTFAFRTPTLRNLRFTFPYMHNGELTSLKSIMEFYEDIGNRKSRHPMVDRDDLDPFVAELDVDVKNMGQIINFLLCLNDEDFTRDIPDQVPSGLPVGGNIE